MSSLITMSQEVFEAAVSGDLPVLARRLGEQGCEPINVVNSHGDTACMLAAMHGHLAAVSMLCSQGASVDLQNTYRCTALHWAVQWGHAKVVSELVRCGADTTLTDSKGKTAVELAAGLGRDRAAILATIEEGKAPTAMKAQTGEANTEETKREEAQNESGKSVEVKSNQPKSDEAGSL